jgi:hypothetical protein
MKEEYSKEFHMPGNFGTFIAILSLTIMLIYAALTFYKKLEEFGGFNIKEDFFGFILVLFVLFLLLRILYRSIFGYKIRITDEGLFIRNKKKAHIYWGDYEGYSINGTLVTFKGKHKGVGELKEEMDFGNLAHWIEPELKKQLPKLPPKKEKGVKRLIKKYLNYG